MATPCSSITSPNHHGRHEMDVETFINIATISALLLTGASLAFLVLLLYFISMLISNEEE
jgi:hypothetical protein